jgi:chaperonin cofactor prefoldin
MELDALIAELAKLDKAKVADALHSGAPSIWQEVFNKGHATATAASGEKVRTLETKVANTEAELTTAKQQLTEAEKGKPDVEKIRADFTKEIGDLTQKHEKEKNQLKADLERERKSTVVATLKAALGAKIVRAVAEAQRKKEAELASSRTTGAARLGLKTGT